MPIKLLISDVDGTLVTREQALTTASRDAVARLRAHGVAFAITSGRPPRGLAMLVGPLGITTPLAAFNGGMIMAPDLTTILEQHTLPADVAGDAGAYLTRSGLDAWVYRGTDWYIRRHDAPRVAREERNVRFEPTVVPDLAGVLGGAVKIVGVSMDLMFGLAGTSIAMGNASLEVRRCARHVTTSNEGFANAVDWFVLGTRTSPPPKAAHA